MIEARKRRRMQPTLLALEDRKLLSTFTVTSTLDDGSMGTLRGRSARRIGGGAETILRQNGVQDGADDQLERHPARAERHDRDQTMGPKKGVTVNAGGNSRVFQVDRMSPRMSRD